MKEKVLVFGAGGMLASALRPLLKEKYAVVAYTHAEADIYDEKMILELVKQEKPQWVINLAAYTDVDGCEKNVDLAFRVNAEGVRVVAQAAKGVKACFVQLSTDFIFDGTKASPYLEEDVPNPQSVYARSKYEGERFAFHIYPEGLLLVRTSWLYGAHGKNFVDTILKLAREKGELRVVSDQRGRPTYTCDLAQAVVALMGAQAKGIVHFANRGETSWCDFAKAIVRSAALKQVAVHPITSAELNRPATRPSYSVLSTEKYEKLTGKNIRHWQETLEEYLSHGSPVS